MRERQQDVLRLQPQMIPALRMSFGSAITDLDDAILGLTRNGFLPEPWLGDEVSGEVAVHYTTKALRGPDSSFQALISYRDELRRVHDTLQQMEDSYRRTDGDNAAEWGRLT